MRRHVFFFAAAFLLSILSNPALAVDYTITTSGNTGAVIFPSGPVTVVEGDSQTIHFGGVGGLVVASVTVDGEDLGSIASYTFENVSGDHSISVVVALPMDTGPQNLLCAGDYHSFATKSDNSLWAWGANSSGQLGVDATFAKRSYPELVGSDFRSVASGSAHTLAIKINGTVWAWGSNTSGQLGDSTSVNKTLPVELPYSFKQVAAGFEHSLGLKSDGTLWAWGYGYGGALGNGSEASSEVPIQVGTDFALVDADTYFSMGLKTDGSLWVWGSNRDGQLGDPNATMYTVPTKLEEGFVDIAVGWGHALALKVDGTVWAWGWNNDGTIGNGSTENASVPTKVDGSGYTAIFAGGCSYALKADGTLWGWGPGPDGTSNGQLSPVQVGTGYVAVAAGISHTLGLKSDGTVESWGTNTWGQLGRVLGSTLPAPVWAADAGTDVFAINILSAKGGSLYVDSDIFDNENPGSIPVSAGSGIQLNATWDWGYYIKHVMIDGLSWGADLSLITFEDIRSDHNIQLITEIGENPTYHYFSVTASEGASVTPGGMPAVLENEDITFLFEAEEGYLISDVLIDGVSVGPVCGYTFENVNEGHSIEVQTWIGSDINEYVYALADEHVTIFPAGSQSVNNGNDIAFNIGAESGWVVADVLIDGVSVGAIDRYIFTNVTENHFIRVLAKEIEYTYHKITAAASLGAQISPIGEVDVIEGTDQTFDISVFPGYILVDVVVDGTSVGVVDSYTFTNVTDVHSITAHAVVDPNTPPAPLLSAGDYQSFASRTDGSLWAWGYNYSGELGIGTSNHNLSYPQPVGSDFLAVSSGPSHTLAIKTDGSLWAWGSNSFGQLGDGTTENKLVPVKIGDGFKAVAAGADYSLALKVDGTLYAWGDGSGGTLGNGSEDFVLTPTPVGAGYALIDADADFSMGLKTDGTLWVWGTSSSGQLGDPNLSKSTVPVKLGEGYSDIAVGWGHAMALKADGTVWAWGWNNDGSIGDGTTANAEVPTKVIGEGYTAIFAGGCSYAFKEDGTLWGWGQGIDGTSDWHLSPVEIGTGYVGVSVGIAHTLALMDDGSLVSWGNDQYGQLGRAQATSSPAPVWTAGSGTGLYTISLSSEIGGVVYVDSISAGVDSPETITVSEGSSIELNSYWEWGYHIKHTMVDGVSWGVDVPIIRFEDIRENHTVELLTGTGDNPTTYYFTATASTGASIIPDQYAAVVAGEDITFYFSVDVGYRITDVLVDGASVGQMDSYTFSNVTAGHTIEVVAEEIPTYTISANARAGASITPDGVQTLSEGDGISFLIALEEPGYKITDVLVDGVSVGVVNAYSFSNVTADHTIEVVTAAIVTHNITATSSDNATITPDGLSYVEEGTAATFTMSVDEGYYITDVLVDGQSVGAVDSYTFENVTAEHTIHVVAEVITYNTIASSTPVGGVIMPYGNVQIASNGKQKFIIRPVHGYRVIDVLVDGASVGAVTDYTFVSDQADHSIAVQVEQVVPSGVAFAAGEFFTQFVDVYGVKGGPGSRWAWGRNDYGKLGIGTVDETIHPDPLFADYGYVAVAAGAHHALALTSGGILWAWGNNGPGQLGVGVDASGYPTIGESPVPLEVGGGYASIAAGGSNSFAIKTDGTLWGWGNKDPWESECASPALVGNDFTYVHLADGGLTVSSSSSAVGLKKDGTLWRIDDGVATEVGSGYVGASCDAMHILAIKADGSLWAWGQNDNGQLGDGTNTYRSEPVLIGTDYVFVSTNRSRTFAIKTDGTLWGWGSAALGDGTESRSLSPIQIGTDYIAVEAGETHTLAMKSDGALWAWGSNLAGQLGDGTQELRLEPIQVMAGGFTPSENTILATITDGADISPRGWVRVSKNGSVEFTISAKDGYHLTDVLVDGVSMGVIDSYTFSDVTEDHTIHVVAEEGPGTYYTIEASASYGATISPDGTNSQIANSHIGFTATAEAGYEIMYVLIDDQPIADITAYTFSHVAADHTIRAVARRTDSTSGRFSISTHSLFIDTSGQLWAWGYQHGGALGNGVSSIDYALNHIMVGSGYKTVSAGALYSMGIRNDNTLWTWGSDEYGKLGNGEILMSTTVPAKIADDYTDGVLASNNTSFGLRYGSLYAWGDQTGQNVDHINNAYVYSPHWITNDAVDVAGGQPFTVWVSRTGDLRMVRNGTVGRIGTGYVAVAAGRAHVLAVKHDGTLWEWDEYDFISISPYSILNESDAALIGSGFMAVSAGSNHSIALKEDGTVWAWGRNHSGQVGDGSLVERTEPAQVLGNVTAISAGDNSNLAMKSDGSLWAWGHNYFGQLGDGTRLDQPTPMQVWPRIHVPARHTITATADTGGVISPEGDRITIPGENVTYTIGASSGYTVTDVLVDGVSVGAQSSYTFNRVDQDHSIHVVTIVGVHHTVTATASANATIDPEGSHLVPDGGDISFTIEAASGYRIADVLVNGESWGPDLAELTLNDVTEDTAVHVVAEQIFHSITTTGSVGVFVTPLGAQQVAAGSTFRVDGRQVPGYEIVDIVVDGTSLGPGMWLTIQGVWSDSTIEFKAKRFSPGIGDLGAGSDHSVRLIDGTVWAWGGNANGQLGNGSTTASSLPVSAGSGYAEVAAGINYTLGLKEDGTVWSWGRNDFGQLGIGTYTDSSSPVEVGGGYAAIVSGGYHSFGLKEDGTLWGWGQNLYSNLGDGDGGAYANRTAPVYIGADFVTVTAGLSHSLGIKRDGTLWTWGSNEHGELGRGNAGGTSNIPIQIGSDFIAVAGGTYHSLALKRDGTLWAWGYNANGQLGDGTTEDRLSPVQVGEGFMDIAANGYHSFGLKTDGTLWAWGQNDYGQLGLGTIGDVVDPTYVGDGFIAVDAGWSHTMAFRNGGEFWTWGRNQAGQLGDGTTTDVLVPTKVEIKTIFPMEQIGPVLQMLLSD